MNVSLLLSAEGNKDRILGCTNLDAGRSVTIPLGTTTNQLYFTFGRNPVTLSTYNVFLVNARTQDVCQLGTDDNPPEIIIHRH